jgi:hypothetical protein
MIVHPHKPDPALFSVLADRPFLLEKGKPIGFQRSNQFAELQAPRLLVPGILRPSFCSLEIRALNSRKKACADLVRPASMSSLAGLKNSSSLRALDGLSDSSFMLALLLSESDVPPT